MPEATSPTLAPPSSPSDSVFVYPTSAAQRRLWFLDQAEPGTPLYNVWSCVRLTGQLNVAALNEAFDRVVARHEMLRTRFAVSEGEPIQIVGAARPVTIEMVDLTGHAAESRDAEAMTIAAARAREPFDLSTGPLLRVALLRLQPHDHLLLVVMHHIVCDGWSVARLFDELGRFYDASCRRADAGLPDLPIQYGDFAAWESERLEDGSLDEDLEYWRRTLAGAPALNLPTDRPRPPRRSSRGGWVSRRMPARTADALKALGSRHGATLFMTALAAFATLLHRYGGDQDLVVGAPIANRDQPEVEPLIGLFVNTLALRVDLSGDPTFGELLRRVRDMALAAYAHQHLPFDRVVGALAPERSGWATPLVQVMLAVEHDSTPAASFAGLDCVPVPVPSTAAKFDLTLFLVEGPDGLSANLEYSEDLFDESTAARMLEHLHCLIESAATDAARPISQLSLLDSDERHKLVSEWNDTASPYPRDAAIHQLIERHVAMAPDRIAIVDGDVRLSYSELDRRATALARALAHEGVGRGVAVCVCLPRGAPLVVSLLAVLKTGATYVPVDPAYPADRIAWLIADTAAPVAVTASRYRHLLPAGIAVVDVDAPGEPRTPELLSPAVGGGDPACIIYTSGSTGRPKGALIPHRAIVRLVANTNYIRLTADDVVAHVSNIAFDAAAFETWGALVSGATVVMLPTEVVLSPALLAGAIEKHGVTTMFLTTSLFNDIARRQPSAFRRLKYLLFGGEMADARAAAAVREAGAPAHLLNVYGPTETTVFATAFEVTAETDLSRPVPIGRPIANTTVFVLDRHATPVPIGVPGEIYIGGDGVALGYHARPQLTAERFVADPFCGDGGGRLYRTGDLGRYRADGTLEILGRLDDQVKVRGFRVEPGEIEAVLQEAPAVAQAAVVAEKEAAGVVRLVAYVSPRADRRLEADDLRRFLQGRLPAFMIPGEIVALDHLPLNANGKVDRAALRTAQRPAPAAARSIVAPRDPLEALLAHLWEDLLGVRPVGIHDDFFALGGHSLLAARMIDEADRLIGRRVPLSVLMRDATVAALANAFVADKRSDADARVVTFNEGGNRTPLFFLHGDLNGGGLYCANLARHLDARRPLLAVHPHLVAPLPRSIEAMADDHLRTLRAVQPRGPYLLGGYCHGGLVACEMASRLRAQGEDVPLVVVVDGWAYNTRLGLVNRAVRACANAARLDDARRVELFLEVRAAINRMVAASGRQRARLLVGSLSRIWRVVRAAGIAPAEQYEAGGACGLACRRHSQQTWDIYEKAVLAHVPRPYDGRVALFLPDGPVEQVAAQWRRVARRLDVYRVEGDHTACITTHVTSLASALDACLAGAAQRPPAAPDEAPVSA